MPRLVTPLLPPSGPSGPTGFPPPPNGALAGARIVCTSELASELPLELPPLVPPCALVAHESVRTKFRLVLLIGGVSSVNLSGPATES